jgi:hypothetical protein
MPVQVEKWRLVGGPVYRLAKVFDNCVEAVRYAKSLREEKRVFLSRTQGGQWAVYWRPKEESVECKPRIYSAN